MILEMTPREPTEDRHRHPPRRARVRRDSAWDHGISCVEKEARREAKMIGGPGTPDQPGIAKRLTPELDLTRFIQGSIPVAPLHQPPKRPARPWDRRSPSATKRPAASGGAGVRAR